MSVLHAAISNVSVCKVHSWSIHPEIQSFVFAPGLWKEPGSSFSLNTRILNPSRIEHVINIYWPKLKKTRRLYGLNIWTFYNISNVICARIFFCSDLVFLGSQIRMCFCIIKCLKEFKLTVKAEEYQRYYTLYLWGLRLPTFTYFYL